MPKTPKKKTRAASDARPSQTETYPSFYTAEEIQRAFYAENEAIRREQDARSAIKSERAKRDRERSVRRPKPGEIDILQSRLLAGVEGLRHGFSTRQGGVSQVYGKDQLNLGFTPEDTRANVLKNRRMFLQKMTGRARAPKLAATHQIHSSIIWRVGPDGQCPTVGDGLITSERGVALSVRTADCTPILIVDPTRPAIGVFHAGWRGTLQRIVEKGVGEMRRQLGCRPEELLACVGPRIGECCYSIGEEVEEEFNSQFAYAPELFHNVFDSWSLSVKYPLLFLNQRAPGHGEPAMARHLDLGEANRRQLLDAGLQEQNIEVMRECTSCRTDRFFSYRKEQATGRMMAAAVLL